MNIKPKPGYKITEIGEIPEDWEVVNLGSIVNPIKGKKPNKLFEEPKDGTLPYLTAETMRTGIVKRWARDGISVRENDAVLIWDGSYSGDVFIGFKGILASTMVKLEPEISNLDKIFLYNFLKTRFHVFNYTTTGTAVPHVSKSVFNNLFVPLPPYLEQQKIAEVLSAADEAIQKTDEIIKKTQELKKGLMQRLLTKGIGHTKFKQTEIGEIPEEWELEDCAHICSEITVGIVVTPAKYYEDSGVPCLRSLNVLENQINSNDLVYISPKANRLHKKSILRAGDVVMVRSGYPGTAAVVPETFDGCNCIDLIIARPNERIDPQFLTRFINSQAAKRQIFSRRGGSAQQHFNVGAMKKLRIPVPPKQEQKQIVRVLSACEEKIEKEKQRKEQLEKLKKGLMQDLLTGRVRVKVN